MCWIYRSQPSSSWGGKKKKFRIVKCVRTEMLPTAQVPARHFPFSAAMTIGTAASAWRRSSKRRGDSTRRVSRLLERKEKNTLTSTSNVELCTFSLSLPSCTNLVLTGTLRLIIQTFLCEIVCRITRANCYSTRQREPQSQQITRQFSSSVLLCECIDISWLPVRVPRPSRWVMCIYICLSLCTLLLLYRSDVISP